MLNLFINLLNIHFPFEKQIISFLLWLDSVGYKIFSIFYNTFIKLAQQELFQVDAFKDIYNNIYVIVGVIALFLMAFTLLKGIVNPDENKGGKVYREMGIRFFVSMILIILLPTLFGFLRDFQNSLLEYNVVPKVLLDNKITIQPVDENGNKVGSEQYLDIKDINVTSEILQLRTNEMIATLISGLMYPLKTTDGIYDGDAAERKLDTSIGAYRYYEEDGEEWSTDVSEFWDGSTQTAVNLLGCAAGGVALVALTVWSGGLAAIGGLGLGSTLLACVAGGTAFHIGGSAIAAISADEYTWTNALQAMTMQGKYSQISLFAGDIVDGRFHYTPIISTIVVAILVYIMISFCIDVVVRQAKLIFYQLLAPVCFMISVIPKKKDLMANWFKLVVTLWLELFVRIGVVCAIVLLVGKLDLDNLTTIFHPIISTFIILGIVIFAKQIPKLLKDLTGLDSKGMKLNLREKIADGGGYALGGLALAGGKSFARGVTRAVKRNFEQDPETGRWRKKKDATAWSIIKDSGKGVIKSIPGVISSQVGGATGGYKAKNLKDMIGAANKAVSTTEARGEKRSKYFANAGGTIGGVKSQIQSDVLDFFMSYIGFEPDYSVLKEQKEVLDDVSKTLKEIKATSEDYIDKHKYEFYVELPGEEKITPEDLAKISYYNNLKKNGNEEQKRQAEAFFTEFDSKHRGRLDVLEKQVSAIEKRGIKEIVDSNGNRRLQTEAEFAKEIADAQNTFNKARKDLVDAFVTNAGVRRTVNIEGREIAVNGHFGAEKEAASIASNLGIINDKLRDYRDSAVVKYFRENGTILDNGKPVEFITLENMENAKQFVKNLKDAADYTNANISKQYEALQRKNAKKNNGGNK